MKKKKKVEESKPYVKHIRYMIIDPQGKPMFNHTFADRGVAKGMAQNQGIGKVNYKVSKVVMKIFGAK